MITTTSTSATAVQIIVNTASGGTGNASVGAITTATSGGVVISSNGGSILYSGTTALSAAQQGTVNGGSTPSAVIAAKTITLTATGAGSIGTPARPIQSVVGSTSSKVTLSAGSGGDFLVDWSGNNLTLAGAIATGAGNIMVVSANAGGHNLIISGNVNTGSGNIFLAADDNFSIAGTNTTIGGVVGSSTFSGTIQLFGNRDQGNAYTMSTTGGTVTTTNTGPNAVPWPKGSRRHRHRGGRNHCGHHQRRHRRYDHADEHQRRRLDRARSPPSAGTVLNAGPAGHVVLTAVAPDGGTNIQSTIGSSTTPITVTAATVSATAVADLPTDGAIFVTSTVSTTFTGNVTGTTGNTGSINFIAQTGTLTVGNSINTNGGAINLTSTGTGIVVANVPGSATSGAVVLTSSAAPIVISKAFTFPATGAPTLNTSVPVQVATTLTLAPGSTLNQAVQVNSGGVINGSGAITGAVSVSGSGQIGSASTVNGIVSAAGITLNSSAVVNIAATGAAVAGTDYGQIESSGDVTLAGALLNFNPSFISNGGDTFLIVRNDSPDPVSGLFSATVNGTLTSLTQGAVITAFSQNFTISYEGGDGNDVVLTRATPPTYYVEADGWAGQGTFSPGTNIPDADPVNAGSQPALFGGSTAVAGSGFHAFTSVSAALAQITLDGAAASGASLIVNGGVYNEAVVGNSNVTLMIVQGGPVTFSSLASSVLTETIDLSNQGGFQTTLTIGDSTNTEIDSPILGPGSLVKTGSGVVKLAAVNSYTGTTQINAGTLSAGIANAFSTASAVTVGALGTLSVNGFGATIPSLSGAGTVNDGAATAGTLTISSASGTTTFTGSLQNGGSGTLSVVKAGASTQIFAGTDTYTGATSVSAGVLQAGSTTAFGTASAITLGSSGTFNLGGFNVGLATLAGSGKVGNGVATPATLTLGLGNVASTYAGVIQDGASGTLTGDQDRLRHRRP